MARADRFSLTPEQEKILVEARATLSQLISIDPFSRGVITAFGTNTLSHQWVTDMVEDIEHLLGY